jgi:hypothetical protein
MIVCFVLVLALSFLFLQEGPMGVCLELFWTL